MPQRNPDVQRCAPICNASMVPDVCAHPGVLHSSRCAPSPVPNVHVPADRRPPDVWPDVNSNSTWKLVESTQSIAVPPDMHRFEASICPDVPTLWHTHTYRCLISCHTGTFPAAILHNS